MRRIKNKLALTAVLLTCLVIGSKSLMGASKAQQVAVGSLIEAQRVEQLDAAVRDLASLKPRVDELQQKVTRLEEANAALNKRLAALDRARSQEIKK
jgi:septal ring factor EnvC (AmiA/AmiB activator)